MSMNVFRILGDLSHLFSKCILMTAIHMNKSAEGVSLITQVFYAVVFCTRYIDLFIVAPWTSWWNFCFKIFYIASSFYILNLMLRVYARTREREAAWKLGAYCLGGSLVLAPILNLILRESGSSYHGPIQMLIDFSIILESVCVLPQLLLLRQTTVPTVIDSFYLVTLGSYRALYCLNWVYREIDIHDYWRPDPISVPFGIIQTILYVDFAWVYWTRQRVKLRSGGIVDADDLNRGWLVGRILGRKALNTDDDDDDEESRAGLAGAVDGPDNEESRGRKPSGRTTRWGSKGISVSADDTIANIEQARQGARGTKFSDEAEDSLDVDAPDARMRDPDELARALDEDDDDDNDEGMPPPVSNGNAGVASFSGGEEWRK